MEVANLFNLQNKNQFTNALLALRQRYKDEDLVNKIQEVFVQRHSAIVKSAKKFAVAIKAKYAQQNVPFHQLLMKARAHAKKHHLSEAEFSEFQRIYEQELAGSQSPEVLIPVTNLMKVLGNINSGTDSYFNVEEADYRNLQEILKLHEASKPLHAQVILQAIQYGDFDDSALVLGQFDRTIHNLADHVHPVIAALFIPKMSSVDEHFLFSNMSGIVKARYNRTPLTTRPDYELFYSLVTDPNDVVCDTRTPVGDLLHRCNLQNQLWNSVLHLRNGQVFNNSLREFVTSVDVCRLNKYDNPDFVYGRHDGTIMKRLFSAFSYRPTVVATLPVANLFAYNPYSQTVRPTVTSIPMINVRLSNFGQAAAGAAPQANPLAVAAQGAAGVASLSGSLAQTLTFIEGSAMVNRHTSVMLSKEVMVFYVDRRQVVLNVASSPFNVLRLPTSVAGLERINNIPLQYEPEITIPGTTDVYEFVSGVIADINQQANPNDPGNYVIGSSCVLFNNTIGSWYHYTPSTCISRNAMDPIIDMAEATAINKLSTNGVIFIYRNMGYQPNVLPRLAF
jgi:hypothetical protein